MRMASMVDMDTSLLDYSETDVHLLFKSLGFPQYETRIHDNSITGDVLATLHHEELKDLGVTSVGQRLTILKAVYALKHNQGIAIEPDDYIPPCLYPLLFHGSTC
jgi:protein STE50